MARAGLLPPIAAIALIGAAIAASRAVEGSATVPPDPPPPAPGEVPRRIVSASLATDEMLLALLPPERLTAVSTFADDPAASNVVALARRVRHHVRGDAEQVLALEPDVVFGSPYSRPDAAMLLRRAGVPVVRVADARTLDQVAAELMRVGRIVGRESRATALVDEMHLTVRRVRARVAGAVRPRVLLHQRGGYTAGRDTIFDELLGIAGARNAAAEAGVTGHEALAVEQVLAMDPDIVLDVDYRADGRARDAFETTGFAETPIFAPLRAVREHRVLSITPHRIFSPSHHAAEGAEELARLIHPERFESERAR